jgi:tRNA1Val (adenine37-N6)-methyltransferase
VAEVNRLVLHQPAKKTGYRVNADAFLLADFAGAPRRVRHVIDLGSGVGAVGLSLLHSDRAERATLVEVDDALVPLAARNIEENGFVHRAEIVHADVAKLRGTSADLVVCNPPYVEPGRGRAPSPTVARAKQGSLSSFLDCARRILGRRAHACFVYPAIEATTLFVALRERGLEPKRVRFVHAKRSHPARVVLVDVAAGKPGGLVVEPPLFEISS